MGGSPAFLTLTHFSPCSTRGTAPPPRLGPLWCRRCTLPDCALRKWTRNTPDPRCKWARQQRSLTRSTRDNWATKVQRRQHTPLRQTCVSELQEVKFSFGSEAGHSAVAPLHLPSLAQSESSLHLSLVPLNEHVSVQHGPWLGLCYNHKPQVTTGPHRH